MSVGNTDGFVALVSGAASGMGHAVATRFLDAGWTVLPLDLREPQLEGSVLPWAPVDVCDRSAVREAVQQLPAGALRAVLNVAGLAEPAFTTKIGSAEAATYLTAPVLPPDQYPPAGQAFFRTFEEKYGHTPAPYAIYGYEAMKVALLAIEQAGENGSDRQAVVDAFFAIKDRDSVLGKYSIDDNGDTTASQEGGYRVEQGKQVFDTVLTAKDAA